MTDILQAALRKQRSNFLQFLDQPLTFPMDAIFTDPTRTSVFTHVFAIVQIVIVLTDNLPGFGHETFDNGRIHRAVVSFGVFFLCERQSRSLHDGYDCLSDYNILKKKASRYFFRDLHAYTNIMYFAYSMLLTF